LGEAEYSDGSFIMPGEERHPFGNYDILLYRVIQFIAHLFRHVATLQPRHHFDHHLIIFRRHFEPGICDPFIEIIGVGGGQDRLSVRACIVDIPPE
jgi:hypothetical protein